MPESDLRPHVFIGSSEEGLEIAKTIESRLQHDCAAEVWNQMAFGLGKHPLESLVAAAERSDFAILVLRADDLLVSREVKKLVPRDNVLFELGLFMGALGRMRTFMVMDRRNRPNLPTDLEGIGAALYEMLPTGNLDAALRPACTRIREAMGSQGPRRHEAPAGTGRPDQAPSPTGLAPRRGSDLMALLSTGTVERLVARHGVTLSDADVSRMHEDFLALIRLLGGFD